VGVTFQKVRISNPRRPGTRAVEVEFLVDTGAIFSVVPRTLLRKLGIRPMDRQQFSLADGTKQEYPRRRGILRARGQASNVEGRLRAFIPARASEGARRNSDPVHPRLSSQEPTAIVS